MPRTFGSAMYRGMSLLKAFILKSGCCTINPRDMKPLFEAIFIKKKLPWLAVLKSFLAVYRNIHPHLKNFTRLYPHVTRAVYICNSWKQTHEIINCMQNIARDLEEVHVTACKVYSFDNWMITEEQLCVFIWFPWWPEVNTAFELSHGQGENTISSSTVRWRMLWSHSIGFKDETQK